MTGDELLQKQKDRLRKRFLKYTRKAFRILPRMERPRILDVGCGSGVPTFELARLGEGEVVGIDIDEYLINRLAQKIKRSGWSDRVKAVNCSMLDMDFPDESFDIIWAEGSTYVIGFERSLTEWWKLLKCRGCLVTHEMNWSHPDPPQGSCNYWKGLAGSGIRAVTKYLEQTMKCGYEIIGYFPLPDDAWWTEYYEPLEKRLRTLRQEHINDAGILHRIDREQREVDLSRKYHQWYGSLFIMMQKIQESQRIGGR